MSQMFNFLSFPPEAMYFPLGEMETPLMLELWALKVFLTWMLVFQILSLPSHPTEAKKGGESPLEDFTMGEYLIQEIQSEWLLVSDSNLS